jgi:thioredoxin-related protein
MTPIVNGLQQKYLSQIKFADLDFYASQNKDLARQLGAAYHPTFVLVDGNGKTVRRWAGAVSAADLEAAFKSVLPS